MAYRPLAIGGQVAGLGAPEDILAQSINAGAARDARRRAALDAQKAQLDLAKQAVENQEYNRGVQERTKSRAILGDFIRNRDGAMDIPIGVQSPEFAQDYRPSNAPFGPMNAPAPKPNRMERDTELGLAAVNPDLAEAFRKGQLGERQGMEDRSRSMAKEDQAQIQTGATFDELKNKNAADAKHDADVLTETERQNRAKNNIDWFNAKSARISADKKGQAKPIDPMKLAKLKGSTASAINEISATQDVLKRLQAHPGLKGLSGISGKTPYLDFPGGKTNDAEALRQQLTAKSAFAELQKMRASSPTGGALGQVSDKEEQMLSNAAAALQRGQSPEQFSQNLKLFNDLLESSKANLRDAYKADYGEDLPDPASSPANAGLLPADQEALDWANSNPNDPRAVAIKAKLGGH